MVLRANSSFSDAVAHERTDDYAYLRDDYRNSSAVLSHLQVGTACVQVASVPGRHVLAHEAAREVRGLQAAHSTSLRAPSKPAACCARAAERPGTSNVRGRRRRLAAAA